MQIRLTLLAVVVLLLPSLVAAQAMSDEPPAVEKTISCPAQKAIQPTFVFRSYIDTTGTRWELDDRDYFDSVGELSDGSVLASGVRNGEGLSQPAVPHVWLASIQASGSVRQALVKAPPLAYATSGGLATYVRRLAGGGTVVVLQSHQGDVWRGEFDRRLAFKGWRYLQMPDGVRLGNVTARADEGLDLSGVVRQGQGADRYFAASFDATGNLQSWVQSPENRTADASPGISGAKPAAISPRVFVDQIEGHSHPWHVLVEPLHRDGSAAPATAFVLPPHGYTYQSGAAVEAYVVWSSETRQTSAGVGILVHRVIADLDHGKKVAEEIWLLQPEQQPHCRKVFGISALRTDRPFTTSASFRDDGGVFLHGTASSFEYVKGQGDRLVWIGRIEKERLR